MLTARQSSDQQNQNFQKLGICFLKALYSCLHPPLNTLVMGRGWDNWPRP